MLCHTEVSLPDTRRRLSLKLGDKTFESLPRTWTSDSASIDGQALRQPPVSGICIYVALGILHRNEQFEQATSTTLTAEAYPAVGSSITAVVAGPIPNHVLESVRMFALNVSGLFRSAARLCKTCPQEQDDKRGR